MFKWTASVCNGMQLVRSAGIETRLAPEGRITRVLRSYEGVESIFVPATSLLPHKTEKLLRRSSVMTQRTGLWR